MAAALAEGGQEGGRRIASRKKDGKKREKEAARWNGPEQ
jgi:hypothetical protein